MANPQSLVGCSLSHYRILEEIGAGGMGVVYRAHDERLDRDVALKVLPAGVVADDATRKQFHREALALAKLNHPNIATIYDFDRQEDLDFLTMELIDGEPLSKKLMAGPLSEQEIQRLGRQFAEGLAAAHERGVVHRDLKPGNLLVTPDGRLKILDFGLAKLRQPDSNPDLTVSLETTGGFSGTVPYMPPEQLRGQPVDPRSDIYGAGAVLYEMATGRRAFPHHQSAELVAAILHDVPASAGSVNRRVSAGLESVIAKALEKEPSRRYQSARELFVALDSLQDHRHVPDRASLFSKRLYAAGALTLAVLIAASFALWSRLSGRRDALRSKTTSGEPTAGVTRNVAAPGRRSIAVLGFRNVSGRPEDAWVSTALSEMLTTELAAGEVLRTVSGENVARMKADLSLPEADSYAADTLSRMRQAAGADYFVLGSYVGIGKEGEKRVRVDLRLEDASTGQIATAVSENGAIEELDALVIRAGVDLRHKLGVEDISSSEAKMVRAALPSDSEGARLYSEGLNKMRSYDLAGARELFKQGVAANPNFAAGHSALASVYSGMGYDKQAAQEAKRAFELSASSSRETKLSIEGLYRQTTNERAKAIEIYRTLFNFFPDNLDYGIRLADSLRMGGKAKESLEVLEELKKLPEPLGSSPRISISEAQAFGMLGDMQHELAAGSRAKENALANGQRILAAKALGTVAIAYQRTGRYQEALKTAQEERDLYTAAGDKHAAALAMLDMAQPLRSLGDPTGALKVQQQALAIQREVGDQRGLGVALNNLATNLIALGDVQGAVRSWQEELQICKEIDDKEGVAAAHLNLGGAFFLSGDLRGARKSFEQALAESEALGDKRVASQARQNLAESQALLGDLRRAESNSRQALAAARATGDKSTEGSILESLGKIAEKRGNLAEARERFSESLSLRNSISEKGTAAETSVDLAELAIEEGRPEDAAKLLEPAKAEFRKEKLSDDELLAEITMAKAMLAMGNVADAETRLESAKALVSQAQDRAVRLAYGLARGRTLALAGKNSAGMAALQDVLREAEGASFAGQALEARLALAEITFTNGQKSEGQAQLAAVKADATARGFLLIARKAAALSRRGP